MITKIPAIKTDFAHFTLEDKARYEEYLSRETERGCEFSFANLYLWGRQCFASCCIGVRQQLSVM